MYSSNKWTIQVLNGFSPKTFDQYRIQSDCVSEHWPASSRVSGAHGRGQSNCTWPSNSLQHKRFHGRVLVTESAPIARHAIQSLCQIHHLLAVSWRRGVETHVMLQCQKWWSPSSGPLKPHTLNSKKYYTLLSTFCLCLVLILLISETSTNRHCCNWYCDD